MSTLEIDSQGLFSPAYSVVADNNTLATIENSEWKRHGKFRIGGNEYDCFLRGWWKLIFSLHLGSDILATARYEGWLPNKIGIEFQGDTYILERKSAFRQSFSLLVNGQAVGDISPQGWTGRRFRAVLPDTLPAPFQLFLVWAVIMLQSEEACIVA